MATNQTVKKIVNSWIDKGNNEQDVFNKFICYWIPFNAIYMFRYTVKSDRDGIESIKKESYFVAEYKKLLTESDFINRLNELKLICPVTSEKSGNSYNINNNNFSDVIEILYQARCNLFHGSKDFSDKRDIAVITAATPVLARFVNVFSTYI
jgi:hypothetical protein